MVTRNILFSFFLLFFINLNAQVSIGSGSYSTSFPGTDAAGRNGFPSGTPYVSGSASGKPVPTNDWWSKLVKEGQADNLFNYPFTMKTLNTGLIVSYIPWGVIGDSAPIEIGLTGLTANAVTVSDYSDWTVTMDWTSGMQNMKVTAGVGMPFLYFQKSSQEEVSIKVNSGTVFIDGSRLLIENASHGADFVIFAPSGSTWSNTGTVYSSNLNGANYWSLAMLPQNTTNPLSAIEELSNHAFVFPADTKVSWSYDESTSKLYSTYTINTSVKEGTQSTFYQGLLPHHWAHLANDSPLPNGPSYLTVRGEMKILKGNTFSLEHTFSGILPTLPNLAHNSEGFDIAQLVSKVRDLENSGLDLWTDSYNEGQLMNRLIQTARIAHEMGLTEARNKLINTVKERLENWLSYAPGEVAFLFYYQPEWTSLIGYPAGHGQDNNINDHHFHWGYFIHAAAFVEQFEPGWLSQWGGMLELLIRDAASADRSDTLFPFLRNFSPFAGHSWANGFASFPQGNDQESTSESMQFNSSLIHYGSITGNNQIRDLGIFLYTTEKTAIEEYWFDVNERNFQPNQQYSLVSRVWGNSYDNGTFWTSDITASYGIEMYPIHGGSFYLGANKLYVGKVWDEIERNTEILNPAATNPNLWHDTFWKYLALIDPGRALELYQLSPNRNLKFGISDAQTYYWLHALNALGLVRPDITANEPIAMVFEKDSKLTYIVHNYSDVAKTVSFSDGFELFAPPQKMTTSADVEAEGVLTTDFNQAYANSTVNLRLETQDQNITRVDFYTGNILLFSDDAGPYEYSTEALSLGVHSFYTRLYVGSEYTLSNSVEISVGEQLPYQGAANTIPGVLEAGNYDEFEGGIGQNISYLDLSKGNNGDYRVNEDVDVGLDINEGAVVGYIDSGEWLEYTVNVQQSGYYTLTFRYASGNSSGGGPFELLLDEQTIASPIVVSSTSSTNWSTFRAMEVKDLPFIAGDHVLRVQFNNGGFNLGRLNFAYDRPLDYDFPVANAGQNRSVVLPETTAILDGSQTIYSGSGNPVFSWSQVYGPSVVNFDDSSASVTTIRNLSKGVYKFRLTVNAALQSDYDEVIIAVNEDGNQPPAIAIVSPLNNSSFKQGETLLLQTQASDLDGSVAKVIFYENGTLIAEVNQLPFQLEWTPAEIGTYELIAVAEDNFGLQTESDPILLSIESVKECVSSGSTAQQGAFSIGYQARFETVGNSVTITFELLDTDKVGVVAYLWQESPFQEFEMEQVSNRVFRRTMNGLNLGEEISFATKFAYAGGLSVTPYIKYVVGTDCSTSGSDTEPPINLSAEINTINATSVSFNLYAEDNSGSVIYSIAQNGVEQLFSGVSSEVSTVTFSGLSPQTTYLFTIKVRDGSGNVSESQQNIEVTTAESTNSSCSGESNISQQGTFNLGYTYNFKTEGNQVIIEFQLLDDRPDLIAYLWQKTPFTESPMSSVGPRTFRAVLNNQTPGEKITYAVKFAFAGGLAVTQYLDYVVGDTCSASEDEDNDGVPDSFDLCPDTPLGSIVDTNGCEVFSLPANTFIIFATSVTCPDAANGSITIIADNSDYSFSYSLDSQAAQPLTDNLQILSNLSAGSYEVCLTVDGVPDFERCYTLEVVEPDPLTASSKVDFSSKNVVLSLSGAKAYQVTFNGKTFSTTENRLSFNLESGVNRIAVSTELDCQGEYLEEIYFTEQVKVYPNPTKGPLQLVVSGKDKEVELTIANISGAIVSTEKRNVPENRIIETTLANLSQGLYLISIKGITLKTTHKVVKE